MKSFSFLLGKYQLNPAYTLKAHWPNQNGLLRLKFQPWSINQVIYLTFQEIRRVRDNSESPKQTSFRGMIRKFPLL
jgi:hypothetical protein